MKALDVKVSYRLLSLLEVSSINVTYFIESIHDFVEALIALGCSGIEVKPKGEKGDVDVKAVTDGKTWHSKLNHYIHLNIKSSRNHGIV